MTPSENLTESAFTIDLLVTSIKPHLGQRGKQITIDPLDRSERACSQQDLDTLKRLGSLMSYRQGDEAAHGHYLRQCPKRQEEQKSRADRRG